MFHKNHGMQSVFFTISAVFDSIRRILPRTLPRVGISAVRTRLNSRHLPYIYMGTKYFAAQLRVPICIVAFFGDAPLNGRLYARCSILAAIIDTSGFRAVLGSQPIRLTGILRVSGRQATSLDYKELYE